MHASSVCFGIINLCVADMQCVDGNQAQACQSQMNVSYCDVISESQHVWIFHIVLTTAIIKRYLTMLRHTRYGSEPHCGLEYSIFLTKASQAWEAIYEHSCIGLSLLTLTYFRTAYHEAFSTTRNCQMVPSIQTAPCNC